MQNIFIDILPPWVETGLQPAFYDLESGTVLQQTARMYAKVRELTEAFNTFTENIINEVTTFEQNTNNTVEEYIQKFNDLHDYVQDYFDNLDVQEEINNKLDEMAEDGVLQEIITAYIQSNVAWTFNNVSEMQSATNLVDGSYARTLGYYFANDGGGALYKITDSSDTVDGGSVIGLTSLQAHLMTESDGTVNVRQFGAKGDDTTDDTTAIQNAIDYCCDNNIKLFVPNGTYLVDKLTITKHLYMDGEDWVRTVIKAKENSTSTTGVIEILNEGLNNSHYSNFYVEGNKDNQTNTINGLYLYATTSKDYRTVLDTIFVHYCTGNGVYIGGSVGGYSIKEIKLNKITINACNEYGLNVESCTDSFWNNIVVSSCIKAGIRFKNGGNHKISNSKCFFNGKGEENISDLESAYRLYPTYHATVDEEPIEGKTYYTLDSATSPYSVPAYSTFSGGSFVEGTTYYEKDSANYYKRYAGIVLETTSAIAISDCECQDNWGDGIYTYNSNHIVISSYLADRNGLLLNSSGNRITYASQNMTRIYFGVFAYTTSNLNLQMSALATTSSSGGQTQRGALYDYSCTRLNGNIVSSNQDVDVDIRMSNSSTINFHKFWIILNGKPLTITYPLTFLNFRNDYDLASDTTQQKSYIKREGNRVYYRLNLTRTGGTPTGSNVNQKIIDPLPVGFRPYQTEVAFATFTDDLNRIGTLVAGANDYYGNFEVRGDSVGTSYSNAVITGNFEINLE